MELYLEILDGKAKGTRVQLKDGLTIGRRNCDLTIEDSKVSSKHARLEQRPDGSYWLIDSGSANGIKFASKKVPELPLVAETSFRLGRTNFKIVGQPSVAGWRETLMALAEKGVREAGALKPRDVFAFPQPIKFAFTRGLQVGNEWIIGYGPREVGGSSVDLPLFEPGLPGKCFQLLPRDGEIVLRTHDDARKKILLNGKTFESAFLRPGDVLEIGNTRIEMTFVD